MAPSSLTPGDSSPLAMRSRMFTSGRPRSSIVATGEGESATGERDGATGNGGDAAGESDDATGEGGAGARAPRRLFMTAIIRRPLGRPEKLGCRLGGAKGRPASRPGAQFPPPPPNSNDSIWTR